MSYSRLHQSLHEPRGTSSAVASVLFSRGGVHHQVTKSGSYIYHGDAATFHEWEFRTRLRVRTAGIDPDRYADAMSKVVDGLRGDAFIIAKEVGLERLWCSGIVDLEAFEEDGEWTEKPGVDVLIDSIRKSVFPLTTYEAKELFRQYCKPGGSLARQNGESMQQYISFRRRCWKLLKELDAEIDLSDGHRADMLLDLAGLERNERTMIQASIGNARDFDKIANALIVQHPRIHLKSSAPRPSVKGGKQKSKSKGKGGGKGGKRRYRNPSGFAYQATEDDMAYAAAEEEPYNDPAAYDDDYEDDDDAEAYLQDEYQPEESWPPYDGWNDFNAYVAEQWNDRWSVEDPLEHAE